MDEGNYELLINANSTNYNCLAASCFLTDNNYQSAQSFSINFHFYWLKIGKIGNYCQFKHQRCEFVELTLNRELEISNLSLPVVDPCIFSQREVKILIVS